MKTLIPILIFTFCIVLISCNVDDVAPQEDTINLTIAKVETVEDNDNRSFMGPSSPILTNAEALEHTLQWISFTTSSLIYTDTAAKNKFLERINYVPFTDNSNTTIDLKDLIGDTIPNTDPFKIAFRTHLIELVSIAYSNGGCPLGPSEAPEPPLDTGDDGNGSPIMPEDFIQSRTDTPSITDIEIMVNLFIEYIISDECIEIYLPIGITDTFTEITSSAHPMNTDTMNNGYHTYPYNACENINYATDNVHVTINYVNNANGPILIARPEKNRSCEYENYNFDFTDFLN